MEIWYVFGASFENISTTTGLKILILWQTLHGTGRQRSCAKKLEIFFVKFWELALVLQGMVVLQGVVNDCKNYRRHLYSLRVCLDPVQTWLYSVDSRATALRKLNTFPSINDHEDEENVCRFRVVHKVLEDAIKNSRLSRLVLPQAVLDGK